jgi:hypothetical protein
MFDALARYWVYWGINQKQFNTDEYPFFQLISMGKVGFKSDQPGKIPIKMTYPAVDFKKIVGSLTKSNFLI